MQAVTLLLFTSLLCVESRVFASSESAQKLSISKLESIVLKTSSYQDYKIDRALLRRKALLLIIPGAWDPYSIHVLKVLRNVDAELAAMGVQVIAVSADSPVRIKNLQDEHDIPFVVASDPELQVARSFDMLQSIDSKRKSQLKSIGVGEVEQLAILNLLFFREDGGLENHWESTEMQRIISQEQVKKMAAHLNALPSE